MSTSSLEYTPEEYKRKLMKLLKRKRKKSAEPHLNRDSAESKGSLGLGKKELSKRQPTPFHPSTSKAKLTTKDFKGQLLFSSDHSDSDYETLIKSPKKKSKKKIGLNSSDVASEGVIKKSKPSTKKRHPGAGSYLDGSPKSPLKRKGKKKTFDDDSTSFQSFTENSPKNKKMPSFKTDRRVSANSEKPIARVSFVELPKSDKKSVKRHLTPYYPAIKKMKKCSLKNHKVVLFPNQNSLETCKSSSDNTAQCLSPNISEFSNYNGTITPNKSKPARESKRRASVNREDISENRPMKAGQINCDNENYESFLSNSSNFLATEESDSELSDGLDLTTTSDHSKSVVFGDMSFMKYNDVEEDSFEKNQDILDPQDDSESQDSISESFEGEIDETNMLTNKENDNSVGSVITAEADYFYIENRLVIVLNDDAELSFNGLMSVEVLQGTVEVLGYTLTTDSGSVEVFSPRGSSLLYLKAKQCVSSPVRDLSKLASVLGMADEDRDKFCQNVQTNSTVLLCQGIINTKIAFLEKHIPQQVFPQSQPRMLRCTFQNKIDPENVLRISSEWDLLADSIESTSKVFICGGKSVGKSTMLRYMLNKLLSKYSQILVIDLDPGQPEFTVSGCVSATVVEEPVFGPNYTHLMKPDRCFFVPNINVSHEPECYLAVVEELILSCADLPKMPTVINYMGFTRGLGLEIFSAVVAHVQPTYMIEIESSSGRRNFERQLTHQLICDRAKVLAKKIDFVEKFEIHKIQSVADENRGWHLQPRQIREMCVLAYLSKMIPQNALSLTDTRVPTFVIDLSLVKIMCNGQIVNPAVINANLVSLCSSHNSTTVYSCHGWGVVRAIDLSENQLFLLTPVPFEELKLVDHLILGSVSLPPSLYMTSDSNTGIVPFVSEGVLVSLGQIPKRTYISRFKTM